MSRSIVSKELLEALQENAPEGYDVKEKLFDIDVYGAGEDKELFETLYLPDAKKDDSAYLIKMVMGATAYDTDDLVFEDEKPLSVGEKLIHEHKKASVVILGGERNYIHYK